MSTNEPEEKQGVTNLFDEQEWLRANEKNLEEESIISAAQKAEADRIDEEARAAIEAIEALEALETEQARQRVTLLTAEGERGTWLRFGVMKPPQQARAAIPMVTVPPGYKLAEIARFLLTRKAYQLYVGPIIADMQREYIDAVAAGREGHARWIAIRVYVLIIPNWLYALVMGKLAALLRRGS